MLNYIEGYFESPIQIAFIAIFLSRLRPRCVTQLKSYKSIYISKQWKLFVLSAYS